MKILLFLAIFFICFSSALEIDFSCPSFVNQNEEFICSIEVIDGNGTYDVKFEIKNSDGKNVGKILDGSEWKSSYYYIKDALEDNNEEKFNLIIEESGKYESFIKIRQEGKTESFNFSIDVEKEEIEENTSLSISQEENKTEKKSTPKRKLIKEKITNSTKYEKSESEKVEIISLNGNIISNNDKNLSVEKRKNDLIEYLPITVIIIIILLTGIYLWEKF